MIKKLRIKFIATAMVSMLAVLVIIMGAVNVFNYMSIVREADDTLLLLKANDGKFPVKESKPFERQPEKELMGGGARPISPELPYESRFFSAVISYDGEVVSCDTDNIAAIGDDEAGALAQEIARIGKASGFAGNYRYIVSEEEDGRRVIFLDCTRNLETFNNFLVASCIISFVGLLAVFALIVFLSAKVVKPISESYEKQKRFITDAGHEIKTPLTIIDADTEVLEMDMADNEWLTDIRKQTKRLASLTNDLIYLSKMDEGPIDLKFIEFSLSDIAEDTAQSFQSVAKTQGKGFSIDIEPMITVKGDEGSIRQLISILLDNALKYSAEGGSVELRLQNKGKTAELTVINDVAELSEEDPERFFDRFYRADKSRNSQTGGFGIGLSVAKAIVAAHKGKIKAAYADENRLSISVTI